MEEWITEDCISLGIPRATMQGQPTVIILSLTEAFQKL